MRVDLSVKEDARIDNLLPRVGMVSFCAKTFYVKVSVMLNPGVGLGIPSKGAGIEKRFIPLNTIFNLFKSFQTGQQSILKTSLKTPGEAL